MRVVRAVAKAIAVACALAIATNAVQAQQSDLPRIVSRDGKHAFLVDGEPFLVLGAQVKVKLATY